MRRNISPRRCTQHPLAYTTRLIYFFKILKQRPDFITRGKLHTTPADTFSTAANAITRGVFYTAMYGGSHRRRCLPGALLAKCAPAHGSSTAPRTSGPCRGNPFWRVCDTTVETRFRPYENTNKKKKENENEGENKKKNKNETRIT